MLVAGRRTPRAHRLSRHRARPHRLGVALADPRDEPQVRRARSPTCSPHGAVPRAAVRLLAGRAVRVDARASTRRSSSASSERVADGRWIPDRRHVGRARRATCRAARRSCASSRTASATSRSTSACAPPRCGSPTCSATRRALPQLMRLAGIDRFLTQKLSWNKTNTFPHHTFWWEGIDGSTVFTHFPPDRHLRRALLRRRSSCTRCANFNDKGAATRSLMPFGFGDGGGGPNRRDDAAVPSGARPRGLAADRDRVARGLLRRRRSPSTPTRPAGSASSTSRRTAAHTRARRRRSSATAAASCCLHEAELWCSAAYGSAVAGGYPKARSTASGGTCCCTSSTTSSPARRSPGCTARPRRPTTGCSPSSTGSSTAPSRRSPPAPTRRRPWRTPRRSTGPRSWWSTRRAAVDGAPDQVLADGRIAVRVDARPWRAAGSPSRRAGRRGERRPTASR